MNLMWGGGVRLQGKLHMPGLPGLLMQCTCSLSGLNVACEYAHVCRRACTLVGNVVFLLSQHDCHVLCWAYVESRRLISLVGWDRCNLLVLSCHVNELLCPLHHVWQLQVICISYQ